MSGDVIKKDVKTLGEHVKTFREHRELTQDKVVNAVKSMKNRTALAMLEQGRRLPEVNAIQELCEFLDMPKKYWQSYLNEDLPLIVQFEDILSEFVGRHTTLNELSDSSALAANELINKLFNENPSQIQLWDSFNSLLTYYGVGPINEGFFEFYFSPSSFSSIDAFYEAVLNYQKDAIRLFPTFSDAFEEFNAAKDLNSILRPIQPIEMKLFQDRCEWNVIDQIEDHLLPELGYISAQRVRQESKEREWLIERLLEISEKLETGKEDYISSLNVKTKNKIDTFLRKFDSELEHGINSPLFKSDFTALKREAKRLAPKTEQQLQIMDKTQKRALKNLSHYLAADHMDVYIATSMRTNADYNSVNDFVVKLFETPSLRTLKLRYFNPTQSWIDDRVAKGLVEALMLKRAKATLYMAQKSDTFGKDSEASVTLGQGKPVIVYVPKLPASSKIDSEELYTISRAKLVEAFNKISDDFDESVDDEVIIAAILRSRLSELSDEEVTRVAKQCWADFDLYSESNRISDSYRESYLNWLDNIIKNDTSNTLEKGLKEQIIGILVAVSINFEKRAKVFKKVHPLALQVILSTGVLNGILVTRTIEQSAAALKQVLSNSLVLTSKSDSENYELIDELTGSTVRVISRNKLLQNAFEFEYKKGTTDYS